MQNKSRRPTIAGKAAAAFRAGQAKFHSPEHKAAAAARRPYWQAKVQAAADADPEFRKHLICPSAYGW